MPRRSSKPDPATIERANALLSSEWEVREQAKGLEPHTRRAFAAQRLKEYDALEPPTLPTDLHDRAQGCMVYWGVIAEGPLNHAQHAATVGARPFEVIGVDRESGFETRVVIHADSEASARVKAHRLGVVIQSVNLRGSE